MSGDQIGAAVLWLVAAIALIAIIVWLLSWLYHRSTKGVSFVRTGFGGERVVIDGGALVLPILHEVTPVSMGVTHLSIARKKDAALITRDRMRVDIEADFFVRVIPSIEGVSMAATTLGARTMEAGQLTELLEGKFVGALRSVAAEMSLDEMHEEGSEYVAHVTERATDALSRNGLELESVAITNLDQADIEYFNPANRFDAEGLTQLIGTIEERRQLRNDIEQTALVSIRSRNLLAEKETLDIERQAEENRAAQKADIAEAQAKGEAEAAVARIESDRNREEAELEKQILLSKKEIEASTHRVASEEARAKVAIAQEAVATSREIEVARRKSAVDRMIAEKDADNKKLAASAEKVSAAVNADAARQRNEAENTLSESARNGRIREKTLDKLEGIVRESVRPLENIEGIKIVQMGGIMDGGQGGSYRSPTDEVIDSALRFRAQAPLIDEMMKEIGVENAGVAKMGDIFRSAKDASSLAKDAQASKADTGTKPTGSKNTSTTGTSVKNTRTTRKKGS